MNGEAFITGLGLITPLGSDLDQTWRTLLAGEFIRSHARAGLSESLARAESPCHSRVARLGIDAARQAIAHARWNAESLADPQTALVIGTSKGPVERWIGSPANLIAGYASGDTGFQPVHGHHLSPGTGRSQSIEFGLAEVASDVSAAIRHGCGPRTTLSAACASGIHALIHATLLLRSGVARRALVVAAEASVHPLFIGSFQRLGVLPPEGVGCRPFDENRAGFLMSEAAAAVCLESGEPSNPICRIERFALGSDATHITGGDPDGRALKHLLARVIDSREVDLIHAHATGTILHDPIELEAIESSIGAGEAMPSVYSHKGAIGHSLGAAGLVSVVLNCMAHDSGIVPPNVRTERPLPTRNVGIARDKVSRSVRRSIAIASGFGGAIGIVSLVS